VTANDTMTGKTVNHAMAPERITPMSELERWKIDRDHLRDEIRWIKTRIDKLTLERADLNWQQDRLSSHRQALEIRLEALAIDLADAENQIDYIQAKGGDHA
jgi:chromosome segregation ATPase